MANFAQFFLCSNLLCKLLKTCTKIDISILQSTKNCSIKVFKLKDEKHVMVTRFGILLSYSG